MEGVGALKLAATERTATYSLIISTQKTHKKRKCAVMSLFPCKFLVKDFDGYPWTTCTIPTIPYEHVLASKHCRTFPVRMVFLSGSILALSQFVCNKYTATAGQTYITILVCKPRQYHYLILPIYAGANARCFWDNLWRCMYVNHYKFHRRYVL